MSLKWWSCGHNCGSIVSSPMSSFHQLRELSCGYNSTPCLEGSSIQSFYGCRSMTFLALFTFENSMSRYFASHHEYLASHHDLADFPRHTVVFHTVKGKRGVRLLFSGIQVTMPHTYHRIGTFSPVTAFSGIT